MTAVSSTQAGAHADLTTSIGFDTINNKGVIPGNPKEVVAELPTGFGGDLVDTPTCSAALFLREACSIGTQIGVATVTTNGGASVFIEPVYNLAPEPGDVAKLGFLLVSFNVEADVTVRPGDYGLQARFQNIPALVGAPVNSTSLTVWGVPSATIHDRWRWNPKNGGTSSEYGVSSTNGLVPYLANPTACTSEPVQSSISVRSYENPNQEPPVEALMAFGPFGGCDRLGFPSTFTGIPTTTSASAPTGLNVELGVHQTNEDPEGLATSALKKAVVTLPEGMTVNPSAGAGLAACTQEEFENEKLETPPGMGCPSDSKLGSVRIKTPALNEEGTGSVFVAQPFANPFSEPGHPGGSLIALYVVARFPVRGVLVKVAGKVSASPLTGRLITTFEGISLRSGPSLVGLPPVPFSVFTFDFRQGQTSPLVSPPLCGTYTEVKAELTPWSDPEGVPVTDISSPFEITSAFDGGACPTGGVPPFHPGVSAGTLNNDAGSFSPFDIHIARDDGEQEITGFASKLPAGLVANLTGVPFCSEAAIALARVKSGAQEEAEPSCPVASQIGHILAGAGVGQVLAYTEGKIYMAGPFEGAPFSLVVVTAAKVGPFDLGTVVVHLPLQIDPVSAAVSVPAGVADQIPHIIDGIVIHVRDVRVYIDKPNFTLNPTSCARMAFSATVIGSGASFTNPADDDPVTVSDPFQAADCASLAFKPTFKVSTSGKTSKVNGASLTVKLTYPKAPLGTQANIAKVKVELPKRLPSRLTTLQKACTETVFDANPAGCPAGSVVGTATAVTPIIPVPLTGPAYFVSHGGAKFPELIIVLEGYGVTLDLHGETFISKTGITTSTFATVPDAPVGSFELKLLQGPHSALAANGNLCNANLTLPTIFTAQNGATLHQNTKITVTECPKHKHKPTKKKGHRANTTHHTKGAHHAKG